MSDTTAAEATPERKPGGWFSRMSLRGRLSMLTAAAVAVVIAVSALACWFIVKDQLYSQVDKSLTNVGIRDINSQGYVCGATPPAALTTLMAEQKAAEQAGAQKPTPLRWDLQISRQGQSCLPASATKAVIVQPSDFSLDFGRTATRSGKYTDGTSAQVRVIPEPNDSVLLIAVPLKSTEDALRGLLLALVAVAAVGVLGAAGIGLLVARAALKPVDRLTAAVEQIARTQEPGTTITVSGKDEIARLSESFNSMSTALASSRDRQSQLIADAGHELRTPLTSLRTNVDLLVRSEETGRPLPEATRTRMMGNMKAQMVELSTLIGDLLELSRPSRPKGSKPLEVLPLHDIVARALDRARLRGPGLTFAVDVRPWYVRADAHAMERAVINLLDNAVKFSPPGGAIDVGLRFGKLTVRDRGPGIPAEDLPHVFDRFWRSPSARQMPGSGLGLAIVAQTVREAGGEVSLAAAQPGPDGATGGALATVLLPGAPTPPPPTPPVVAPTETVSSI